MSSEWKEYTLENGCEITETPVGTIRFQISPTGYINFYDIFPQRVVLNESASRSAQRLFFECTLGICADYWARGNIKVLNGNSTLYLKISKRE